MIKCDQKNCHYYREDLGKESPFFFPKGVCTADNVVLAEAPGGFWLVCRTKIGSRWIDNEKEKE